MLSKFCKTLSRVSSSILQHRAENALSRNRIKEAELLAARIDPRSYSSRGEKNLLQGQLAMLQNNHVRAKQKYEFAISDFTQAQNKTPDRFDQLEYMKAFAVNQLLWILSNTDLPENKEIDLLLNDIVLDKVDTYTKKQYPVEIVKRYL